MSDGAWARRVTCTATRKLRNEFLLPLQLLICRHLLFPQQDFESYEVLPKLMSSGQRLARFSDLFDILPISTSPGDSGR